MREPDAKSGWWQRNWGWCVGCGCLLPLLAIAGLVAGSGWLANQLFTSNEALAVAMDRVNADPRAIEALGQPIETKLWRENTSINFKGRKKLQARFPVSGPKGGGRLELDAHVETGTTSWRLDRLLLHVDGVDEPIDLLEDPADPAQEALPEAA